MFNCQRCGFPTDTHTMSMFNTEEICMLCDKKEREHTDYAKARDAEAAEVAKGNMNFPGIGKPEDL